MPSRPSPRLRSWSLPLLTVIHEEDHELTYEKLDYRLDLGSGSAFGSRSTTPALTPKSSFSNIRAHPFRPPRTVVGTRKARERRDREAERDCAICFELAVAPVRTHCCNQLLCGEHVASYLADPRADGRCPACHAPPSSFTYASLGHPATMPKDAPPAPPPSRAPTPPPFDIPASIAPPRVGRKRRAPSPAPSSTGSAATTIVPTRSSSATSSVPTTTDEDDSGWEDDDSASNSPDDEEERTLRSSSWTLPALVRARALQTRRHAAHSFASVVGLRGVLVCALRIALWVAVVGMLAGRWRVGNGRDDAEEYYPVDGWE
ncbi:TEA domain-containing protein [Mycena kentingensis (nom. inval.)]|nr:TEA domain-containing protein [Mycena kentingensis (nom. inval.)]